MRFVNHGGWEYVERPAASGVVAVVALTDDGLLVLIEQYRPPVGRTVIELPAGLAGDVPGQSDEPLAAAAIRELREETGYQAEQMQQLTAGPSSAGLTSEIVTLFLASGLTKVGPGGGDASEDIRVHEVPLVDVHDWLARKLQDGAPTDPKVYAGLYFLKST